MEENCYSRVVGRVRCVVLIFTMFGGVRGRHFAAVGGGEYVFGQPWGS